MCVYIFLSPTISLIPCKLIYVSTILLRQLIKRLFVYGQSQWSFPSALFPLIFNAFSVVHLPILLEYPSIPCQWTLMALFQPLSIVLLLPLSLGHNPFSTFRGEWSPRFYSRHFTLFFLYFLYSLLLRCIENSSHKISLPNSALLWGLNEAYNTHSIYGIYHHIFLKSKHPFFIIHWMSVKKCLTGISDLVPKYLGLGHLGDAIS